MELFLILLIFAALLAASNSSSDGVTIDCLSPVAKKILNNPTNKYVVRWTIVCGIGRDFEYSLVYDENFAAEVRTGNKELDKQIKREVTEIERLSKLGKGISPLEVIEKCRNAV